MKSTTWAAKVTPPIPSVSEWWIFITNAASPSGSPSSSVNSHKGRSWSKALIPAMRPKSSTASNPAPAGTRARRRCQLSAKSGSVTQRGGANRSGLGTSFMRKLGERRVARSTRSTSCGHSGDRSKRAIATIVERSNGSRSSWRVKASASVTWVSIIVWTFDL